MKRKNVWLENISEFSTNLYVPGHEINILHLFWPTKDRFNERAAEGWTSFSSCRPPPLRRRPGPAETASHTPRPICSLGLRVWTSAPDLQPLEQDAVTWWQFISLRAERIKWKLLQQLEHLIFFIVFFWRGAEGSVHVVVFTRRGTLWKTKPWKTFSNCLWDSRISFHSGNRYPDTPDPTFLKSVLIYFTYQSGSKSP